MKVLVVGAGAWGLPTAAQLALRGHDVELVDRCGPGNPRSSSSGPTRIWRLTHADEVRVRMAQVSIDAMRRLEERSGRRVFQRQGLLWRDRSSLDAVVAALQAVGVAHTLVDAADVARFFPGLEADDRAAVWQEDAGVVLAAESLAAQLGLFTAAGGRTAFGRAVQAVESRPSGARVRYADGASEDYDRVVLAAGPESEPLLASLGVRMPLRPHLEQVVTVGDRERPTLTDALPCLIDGADGEDPVLYAMPTPGSGYKAGLDLPLREYRPDDDDRSPDPGVTAAVTERIRRHLPSLPREVVQTQVCSWTDSPDGRFVLDTVGDVVVACGDSGEGFKFSALMGEVLADLAEHREPEPDVSSFGLGRFADRVEWRTHSLTLG
ncbi:NAD(P)/FAD-dependent oxidoreductase [Herbiconiux sp. SYSU D00978]|uniref:NAD(P)/FAD-dependent oxidoreductase n=1 Tax=Herbiconiux sp. SYSU D00978 TaxID=2812562 RepID=UPI001A963033|nr:FAD-dependent oxidoreductase [Herbiconiux sp. SYSU D00978]